MGGRPGPAASLADRQHEAFSKGAVSKQQLREHFGLAGGKQERILLSACSWEGAEGGHAAKGAGLTKPRLDASAHRRHGKALREGGNSGGTPPRENRCAAGDQTGTPPCPRPCGDRYQETMLLGPSVCLLGITMPPEQLLFPVAPRGWVHSERAFQRLSLAPSAILDPKGHPKAGSSSAAQTLLR